MKRWSTPWQYLSNEGPRQEKNRREIPCDDVFVDSKKAKMTSPVWERGPGDEAGGAGFRP